MAKLTMIEFTDAEISEVMEFQDQETGQPITRVEVAYRGGSFSFPIEREESKKYEALKDKDVTVKASVKMKQRKDGSYSIRFMSASVHQVK